MQTGRGTQLSSGLKRKLQLKGTATSSRTPVLATETKASHWASLLWEPGQGNSELVRTPKKQLSQANRRENEG